MKYVILFWLAGFAGCRRPPVPPEERPWFRDVAGETGMQFTHVTGATGQFYMPEIMGSGCALLDFDNDGDLDVVLVQGAPGGSGARVFRNELIPSGKLHFTDITQQSGLKFTGYGMGVATGDFNNDGKIDLLITGVGHNALYRNNGDGTFTDVTAQSPDVRLTGLWSSSASFFDYDGDGWLDLIVLNYVDYSAKTNKRCYAPTGELDYCTPRAYRALPAHLFHNDQGRFVDVTARSGFTGASGPGLGVVSLDVNDDGWPDLFVANDSSANHLWVNQHDGSFAERALQSGVAYGEDGLAKAGMGVAAGDFDNDGHRDLLVVNLMREGATLFRNTGAGNFEDESTRTAIHSLTYRFTGFGAGWFDFDRDGWLDLFLANGAVTRREEQRGHPYPFRERNLLLRNLGGEHPRFEDVSGKAGPVFAETGVSRGAAFGDIDNDGDVDIVVNTNNGAARLLLNEYPARHWLGVEAEGPRLGWGTRIEVKAAGLPAQVRWMHTDSSYLSANDPRVYFGLANASRIEWMRIQQPGGPVQRIEGGAVRINSVFRIPVPAQR